MKIGIDARSILNPEKGDAIGVGHYTYQLIRHLLKIDKENEYVIFFDFRVREKDVEKFIGVPTEKTQVVYSGLDQRFFEESEISVAKVLGKYDITKKYILFLGTLEPSKNITRLLEAFAKFKADQKQKNSGKFEYQLVLAGKRGWLSQEYLQII